MLQLAARRLGAVDASQQSKALGVVLPARLPRERRQEFWHILEEDGDNPRRGGESRKERGEECLRLRRITIVFQRRVLRADRRDHRGGADLPGRRTTGAFAAVLRRLSIARVVRWPRADGRALSRPRCLSTPNIWEGLGRREREKKRARRNNETRGAPSAAACSYRCLFSEIRGRNEAHD